MLSTKGFLQVSTFAALTVAVALIAKK